MLVKQASAYDPNAWFVLGYQRVGLNRNISSMNFANLAFVGVDAWSAPATQIGPHRSHVGSSEPTVRIDAWRGGSDPVSNRVVGCMRDPKWLSWSRTAY